MAFSHFRRIVAQARSVAAPESWRLLPSPPLTQKGGLLMPRMAQLCTVPGSHATIQEAIDDPACATITLSAQTYPDFVDSCRSVDARPLAAPPALFRALSRPPYQSGEAR